MGSSSRRCSGHCLVEYIEQKKEDNGEKTRRSSLLTGQKGRERRAKQSRERKKERKKERRRGRRRWGEFCFFLSFWTVGHWLPEHRTHTHTCYQVDCVLAWFLLVFPLIDFFQRQTNQQYSITFFSLTSNTDLISAFLFVRARSRGMFANGRVKITNNSSSNNNEHILVVA